MYSHSNWESDRSLGRGFTVRTIILGLTLIVLTVGCAHKPPALTMPQIPHVTTDQKPGAVTR